MIASEWLEWFRLEVFRPSRLSLDLAPFVAADRPGATG